MYKSTIIFSLLIPYSFYAMEDDSLDLYKNPDFNCEDFYQPWNTIHCDQLELDDPERIEYHSPYLSDIDVILEEGYVSPKEEVNEEHSSNTELKADNPKLLCPHCSKVFQLKRSLNRHIYRHCKEKPPYSRTRKKNTKKNKTAAKKTFPCAENTCNEILTSKKGASDHFARHHQLPDQTEWFPCTQENCTNQYTTQSSLTTHKLRVHAKKTIKCPIHSCPALFSIPAFLNEHLKRHKHPMKEKK